MVEAYLNPIEKLTRIEVDRSQSKGLDWYSPEEVDRVWDQMREKNPRYFNGPILAFQRYEPDTGVITAQVEQYKLHAVYNSDHSKAHIDLGVRLFAVTACIQRSDPDHLRFLIGRRSSNSHCYGGLWEFGPSGGVQPPKNHDSMSPLELVMSLMKEVREETGINLDPNYITPRSIVFDGNVNSEDVHFDVILTDDQPIRTNWEYDDTRWVTLDELIAWCDEKPDEIIPTTIAHARFLHEARA